MQVGLNTSGMAAGVAVSPDKDGRDHCVVVIKGTFDIVVGRGASLAEAQEPLVYADVHYGDPASTSVRYESDFAPHKPRVDVLVNGLAYAPGGEAVAMRTVRLEIGPCRKELLVVGDEHAAGPPHLERPGVRGGPHRGGVVRGDPRGPERLLGARLRG